MDSESKNHYSTTSIGMLPDYVGMRSGRPRHGQRTWQGMQCNKKGFYRYVRAKRKVQVSIRPARLTNCKQEGCRKIFFASRATSFYTSQEDGQQNGNRGSKVFPTARLDQVHD